MLGPGLAVQMSHGHLRWVRFSCTGYGALILQGGDRKTLRPSGLAAIRNKIYNISRVTRTFTPAFHLQGPHSPVPPTLFRLWNRKR